LNSSNVTLRGADFPIATSKNTFALLAVDIPMI
jgi:hypothetical protein